VYDSSKNLKDDLRSSTDEMRFVKITFVYICRSVLNAGQSLRNKRIVFRKSGAVHLMVVLQSLYMRGVTFTR